MAVVLLCGCTVDKQCRVSYKVEMWALFQGDSLAADTTIAYYQRYDSITVQGVGNDSILYDNVKSVGTLVLQLRPDTTLTAYSLIYHGQTDTLYIRHNNTIRFVSLACGQMVLYTIEEVWSGSGWIDSVAILDPTLEVKGKDNIRIIVHE